MDLKEIIKWFIPCFHIFLLKKVKMCGRLTYICLFLLFILRPSYGVNADSLVSDDIDTKNVVNFSYLDYKNNQSDYLDVKMERNEERSLVTSVGRTFGRPFLKKIMTAIIPMAFQVGVASTWAVIAALVGVKTLIVALVILKLLLVAGAAKVQASDLICTVCWTEARATTRKRGLMSKKCALCQVLLPRRAHSHQVIALRTDTVHYEHMRDIILERLLPLQVSASHYICHPCWQRADRAAKHLTKRSTSASQITRNPLRCANCGIDLRRLKRHILNNDTTLSLIRQRIAPQEVGSLFGHKTHGWEPPHQKEIHLHIHNGGHPEVHDEHGAISTWNRDGTPAAPAADNKNINLVINPYAAAAGPQTISTPYGNYVRVDSPNALSSLSGLST